MRALLALLLLPGCSLVFLHRPDAIEVGGPTTGCTHSEVWPIVDTVIGAGGILLGGAALVDIAGAAGEGRSNATLNVTALVALSTALLYGLSATHGFSVVAACEPR